MCGIAGAFADISGFEPDVMVRRMTGPLRHRGPDDEGYWGDPEAGIAFGFRRLAIQDLSDAGHQPMHSGSGRYTLVFNGEIYNYVELRRQLESRGHRFRGHSDTEVALAAFDDWGVRDSLPRFNGMFGMGVWDQRRRSLTLLRDRLGIKPLYVYRRRGLVLFASELKSLLAVPELERTLDPEGLTAFLRYLYIPAPRTILRGVSKLLPGHLLEIFDPGDDLPASEPFWSLAEAAAQERLPFHEDPTSLVEETERLITDAVRIRTRADVPVGAFLSGGIDSSLVVALMQQAVSDPVKTFTVAFDAAEHNEAPHAREVAEHLGTHHTEVRMGEQEIRDLVPRIPTIFDEPLADPSQLPTHLISQVARRSVVVALSGDGGDELFGGYNRYVSGGPLIGSMAGIPMPLRYVGGRAILAVPQDGWHRTLTGLARVLPGFREPRLAGEKMHKTGRLMAVREPWQMYESLVSAWPDPSSLVRAEVQGRGGLGETLREGRPEDLISRMMLADQREYLPDDLLAKVDRASMAVSLEARVPLLDHRVVEHSWRLPLDAKIRDGEGKWLLRRILHRHVPRDLVERPKVGFSVPIERWLRRELRPWAEDLVAPATLARSGALRTDELRRRWEAFQSGRDGHALGLWAAVIFQAWYGEWMG